MVGVSGLDHDAALARRPAVPETKVLEDLRDHGGVLDHGDQPHLAAAPAAPQNVLGEHSAQKLGPSQTPRALGIVGASDVVSVGRPLIYSAQQQVEPWLGGGVLDPGPVCLGRGCRS